MLIHLDNAMRTSAWIFEKHGKAADDFLLPFVEHLHAYDGDRLDGCLVRAESFAAHYASCAERFADGRAWVQSLLLRRVVDLLAPDIGRDEAWMVQLLLMQEARAAEYDPGCLTVGQIIRKCLQEQEFAAA